ncbi:MAG: protein kinase domain-containing protein [Planctomycetota bacterium]
MTGHVPTSRLMVLMFTDLVGSVDLKTRLGNAVYVRLIARHDRLFRKIVKSTPGAAILKDTGDGFLAGFATASDGIRAALRFQWAMHEEPWEPEPLRVRVGLHVGEVAELHDTGVNPKLVGLAADLAARIMDLAEPGQILTTRTVFDDARQYVPHHPPVDSAEDLPELKWMAHGPYVFKGGAEPVDVYEVGAVGVAPLREPSDSLKARRAVTQEEEDLLGWRPAVGAEIPGRDNWILERKLGGGAGEVWVACHAHTRTTHVFKFCYDTKRVRAFREELTLFRLLQETLGDRRDIVKLHEVRLEEPPYFLESEYSQGGNLAEWAEGRGGLGHVSLGERLEIVAGIAEAVAAAHSVGVLHKDIKPTNILIQESGDGKPRPCLADFGIGALTDPLLGPREVIGGEARGRVGSEDRGTQMYLPPESSTGQSFTIQGDVYALGVLLYQMAVGDLDRPLAQGWQRDIADEITREDIEACVRANPGERLASAAHLSARLRGLKSRRLEREPAPAPPPVAAPPGEPLLEETAKPSPESLPYIKLRCGERSGREGRVLKLVGRSFTLGRKHCSVVSRADVVSRRHARLKLGERGWIVHDLGSRNGTFLNDERIITAALRIGDVVRLGEAGAKYKVVGLDVKGKPSDRATPPGGAWQG